LTTIQTDLEEDQGLSVQEMRGVADNTKVSGSALTTAIYRKDAFRHFSEYMVMFSAVADNQHIPSDKAERDQWIQNGIIRFKNDLKTSFPHMNDVKFWVTYLHEYAMTREGRVS
jgi:hypothetical protein